MKEEKISGYSGESFTVKNIKGESLFGTGFIYKIIYDDEEKKQIIRKTLIGLNKYYMEYIKRAAPQSFRRAIKPISLYFRSQLGKWQACFKDHHFSNEEEVRFVVHVPDEYPPGTPDEEKIEIKHRVQDGYLVPYVELFIPKKQFDFLGITVSPLAEQELAESTTRSFLRSVGYPCEDEEGKSLIRRSNIPLRF